MIQERPHPSGYIELVDEKTGEVLGRKYVLTSKKASVLCNERFNAGDRIEVLFPSRVRPEEQDEQKGPWTPGELSSKWIKSNAIEIRELITGVTIHRAPYAKQFLDRSNRVVRYHALRSILRRFMEGNY